LTGLASLQGAGGDYMFYNGESDATGSNPRTTYVSSRSQDFIFVYRTTIGPIT